MENSFGNFLYTKKTLNFKIKLEFYADNAYQILYRQKLLYFIQLLEKNNYALYNLDVHLYSFQIVLLQQIKYLLYIFFLLLFNLNLIFTWIYLKQFSM